MSERTTADGEVRVPVGEQRVWDLLTDFEDFARSFLPRGTPDAAEVDVVVEVTARQAGGRPTQVSIGLSDPSSGTASTREVRCRYGETDVVWEILDPNGKGNVTSRFVLVPDDQATTVRNEVSLEVSMPIPDYMKRKGAEQLLDRNLAWLRDRLS